MHQEQEQEHIYNAWLPPCVVEEVRKEPERFHQLVCLLKESLVDESPAARLATTRWIPVITTYVLAHVRTLLLLLLQQILLLMI
jgi:proteasome activator subunit 4